MSTANESPADVDDTMISFASVQPFFGVAVLALAWTSGAAAAAAEIERQPSTPPPVPPRVVLDPLARAIVDSLRDPPPATPRGLIEAAISAADVAALPDALDFYRQFVDAVAAAKQGRGDLLADLGDSIDPAGARRLARSLRPYEPDAPDLLDSLAAAAAQRRRDPRRLAAAIAALRSDARFERLQAAEQLSRCGPDALPALVDLLQSDEPTDTTSRSITHGLIRGMGQDGRDALLAWLGSDDIAHWPGVIAALAASGDDASDFFLAPALSPDAPPAVREAAARALTAGGAAPAIGVARQRLAKRLDAVLTPAALPMADSLDDKRMQTFAWDPQRGSPRRQSLPTRLLRGQRAAHVARDLAALGPTEPMHVRLVLLARLEMETALAADAPEGLDAIPPERLRAALTGPDGFDPRLAAEVADEAAGRGMPMAAAAAARAIRLAATDSRPDAAAASETLPPDARDTLARCLSLPDDQLAFEAAMTLAACGGAPPYRGASHIVRNLRHAATSTGIDRAIVAHPDKTIVEELAAGVSRHGYLPTRVRSGRDAILAARETADTVLVVLAARLGSPSALETVQLLQSGSDRAAPPVLVVVDPLDDAPRGRFLTRLITSFTDVECVAICDRMESLFQAVVDPESGETTGPRLPDVLAIAAGPRAADPARRAALAAARLARARAAMAMLAVLEARGNVPAASARYNRSMDPESRRLAGDLLEALETPRIPPALVRVDAP